MGPKKLIHVRTIASTILDGNCLNKENLFRMIFNLLLIIRTADTNKFEYLYSKQNALILIQLELVRWKENLINSGRIHWITSKICNLVTQSVRIMHNVHPQAGPPGLTQGILTKNILCQNPTYFWQPLLIFLMPNPLRLLLIMKDYYQNPLGGRGAPWGCTLIRA